MFISLSAKLRGRVVLPAVIDAGVEDVSTKETIWRGHSLLDCTLRMNYLDDKCQTPHSVWSEVYTGRSLDGLRWAENVGPARPIPPKNFLGIAFAPYRPTPITSVRRDGPSRKKFPRNFINGFAMSDQDTSPSAMRPMAVLEPGTLAPDFRLHSTSEQPVSLSEFRSSPVILAFYPANWSPVCGDEMALFNRQSRR
jgi:hypothetical protein